MGEAVFVARVRITNDGGTWDSLGIDGTSPRIVFSTSFTLSEDPNSAAVQTFNLAPESSSKIIGVVKKRLDWTPAERAQLLAKGAGTAPLELTSHEFGLGWLELSHGYVDSEDMSRVAQLAALSLAFSGQITEGPRVVPASRDQILTMLVLDGGQTLGAAEVVQLAGGGAAAFEGKAYGPGSKLAVILADLINSAGLSASAARIDSQIVQALAAKGYPAADATSLGGSNTSGPAAPQIRAILKSLALRWTIQNGEFLILDETSVIPGYAPVQLTSELGNIVGRPKPRGATQLEVSTTANTEILPGRPLDVRTSEINTSYRIDSVTTNGDTYSGAQTDAKLDELQVIPGVV